MVASISAPSIPSDITPISKYSMAFAAIAIIVGTVFLATAIPSLRTFISATAKKVSKTEQTPILTSETTNGEASANPISTLKWTDLSPWNDEAAECGGHSTWLISSTPTHICNNKSLFTNFEPLNEHSLFDESTGHRTAIHGRGSVRISTAEKVVLELDNVAYAPAHQCNVLSVTKLDNDHGLTTTIESGECCIEIQTAGNHDTFVEHHAKRCNGSDWLDVPVEDCATCLAAGPRDFGLGHRNNEKSISKSAERGMELKKPRYRKGWGPDEEFDEGMKARSALAEAEALLRKV